MQPQASVIIPAYNASRFIEPTLRSVLAQTLTDLEVLVVDDGSTDTTPDLVRSFARHDKRVRLLRQENKGVAAARNLAIQNASAPLIAPLDADDLWHPQKLERQVRCLNSADPATGLVWAWSVSMDANGHIIGHTKSLMFEGNVFPVLVCSNFIGNASAPLIRKTCLAEVGGYDERFKARQAQGCEDWDLYLRIAERYEFKLVPDYLVGYRRSIGSMSADFRTMEHSYLYMVDQLRRRNPHLPPRLLRWSASSFYAYLHPKSYAQGNFDCALRWLLHSARVDPLRLITQRFYGSLARCLVRMASRSLSSALGCEDLLWKHFHPNRRLGRRKPVKLEMLSSWWPPPAPPVHERLDEKLQRQRHEQVILRRCPSQPAGC